MVITMSVVVVKLNDAILTQSDRITRINKMKKIEKMGEIGGKIKNLEEIKNWEKIEIEI